MYTQTMQYGPDTPTYGGEDISTVVVRSARASGCYKSRRGVVIAGFGPKDPILATGTNAPPGHLLCRRTPGCKATCRRFCNHAEQNALIEWAGVLARNRERLEKISLFHGKVNDDGKLVPTGGPSCLPCATHLLNCLQYGPTKGPSSIWLFQHASEAPEGAAIAAEPYWAAESGAWVEWDTEAFYWATVDSLKDPLFR